MASLCWLAAAAAAAVACLGVPGRGAACWESSVCADPSGEGRARAEFPELGPVDHKVGHGGDDDDDGDLLLRIILALLASKDKTTEAGPDPRSAQRRSYTMEHFRWGKPPGDKPAQPKPRAPSSERRSYAMEHFRWGKPPGSKRGPGRAGAPPDPLGGRRVQQTRRARGRSKAQGGKAGTYRMSHFRWGGSSASKRGGGGAEAWEEKLLVDVLRTVTAKGARRRKGQTKREEEEGGLAG